jgi:hypothetical protein
MLAIQLIIDLVVVFFLVNLLLKLKQDRINLGSFIFWLIFWLATLLIINWPQSSSYFARILGVGRGVDVIIYFSIIILFYFIFYFTLKLRKIEHEITQVVRKIAISEGKLNETINKK